MGSERMQWSKRLSPRHRTEKSSQGRSTGLSIGGSWTCDPAPVLAGPKACPGNCHQSRGYPVQLHLVNLLLLHLAVQAS